MITVLHRGGYAQMITILHREGGVSRDPQKWLRNMCTTPYRKRFSCFHQTNHYWPQEWCLVWDDLLTFGNFHPSIHGFNKTLFGQQITLALSYIFIIDVGEGHLWPKLSLLKKIFLGQDVHLNKGLQTNFNENERNVWCEDISHIFSKHTIVA